MGIPNFSGFVSNNGLRKSYQLSNTYIVIDGNNFLYYLYLQFNRQNPNDFLFGGNYNEYHILFKEFFQNLDKCKITPIVVFDGGLNLQLKDSRMKRFKDTFKSSKKISDNPVLLTENDLFNFKGIFPYLLRESMISVLIELRVHYFVTKLDADNDSAQLANQLKCPLISNDSDFLVMNIDKGVIDCDSLKWKKPLKSSKDFFIECTLYRVVDFLQKFGLKPEMLPIFASLMGNDGIGVSVFQKLFNTIRKTLEVDILYIEYLDLNQNSNERWDRMRALIFWLKRHFFCANQVMDYIKNYYKNRSNSLQIFEEFNLSIKSYEMNEKNFLINLFYHKIKGTQNKDIPIDVIVNEYHLPKWFLMDYFFECNLNTILFTFIESKILLMRPSIEDFNLESCYESSHELYGFLLGLLRINRNDNKPISMTTRNGINIEELLIKPKTHITYSGGANKILPIISEIRQLSQFERNTLLFDILGFSEKCMTRLTDNLKLIKDKEDIEFWSYFLIVIKCWKSKTKIKKYKFDFIRALVLSIIYFKHSSQIRNDFSGLRAVPKQYFKPSITHYYCEFQSLYSEIENLSSILGYDSIPTTKLHQYLNGVLFYNLFNEIIDGHIKLWPFEEHRLNTLNNFILASICIE